jgi:hypothetical protein
MQVDQVIAHIEVEELFFPTVELILGGVVIGVDFAVWRKVFQDVAIILGDVIFHFGLAIHLVRRRNRAD